MTTTTSAPEPEEEKEAADRRSTFTLPLWLRCAHPILFGIAPALSLYATNRGRMLPDEITRPFLLSLALVAVLAGVAYLVARRDIVRGALALSVFLFCFFSYPLLDPIMKLVCDNILPMAAGGWGMSVVMVLIWAIFCGLAVRLALRTRRDMSAAAWGAAAILTVPSFLSLFGGQTTVTTADIAAHRRRSSGVTASAAPPSSGNTVTVKNRETTPDLFLIVLDAYAREDLLRDYYGVDNSAFVAALRERGFLVAQRSRSNYLQTPVSIAATLNLDYLQPDPTITGWDPLRPIIDHNRLAALMREKGGRFISIPTGFNYTMALSADLILNTVQAPATPLQAPFPTPAEGLMIDRTPFTIIPRPDNELYDLHRRHLLGAFDHLGEAARMPGPKFIFAHILSPHPPFVFNAKGEAVTPHRPFGIGDASDYGDTPATYQAGYAGQVQAINPHVLAALDAIHAGEAGKPYVVMLMGDHGAREHTDWESLEKTDVHEGFSDLIAVYCPDAPGAATPAYLERLRAALNRPAPITLVNVIRMLADTYYGADLPRLPDRSYYSPKGRPLTFTDVTAELDAAEAKEASTAK